MRAFLRGFQYAFQGMAYVVRTQRNARVHLVISSLVVVAGLYFRVTAIEWALLALTIGVVLAAEAINTAAELAVDMFTQRPHPLAKAAKDASAASVLIVAMAAVTVGVAIFGSRLWALVF